MENENDRPQEDESKADEPKAEKKRTHPLIAVLILVLGVGMCLLCGLSGLGLLGDSPEKKKSQQENREKMKLENDRKIAAEELQAIVKFDQNQFFITNENEFDWKDIRMEINSPTLGTGYILEHPLMEAGKTYEVGSMQFALKDGTRFNPFKLKAHKFQIRVRIPSGKQKLYFCEFK